MRNRILLTVTGIALLFLIGYLSLPNQLNVQSNILIDAPIEKVFNNVNNLKIWESWSPWKQLDPAMKINYGNQTTGVGGSYQWTSDHPQVDRGSLEISNSIPNQLVETKIYFRNDKSKPGNSQWSFENINGQTKVTWSMHGDLGANPLNKFIGMIVNSKLGTLFDLGLNKLKTVSEQKNH